MNSYDKKDVSSPRSRRMSLTFDCIREAVTDLYRVDDFTLEELGSGFFSRVYKVRHRTTGDLMVLKLNKNSSNRQQALKEVQLMKRLGHPNILRFLGVCVHEGQLHPLSEFINGGNLEELLLDRKQSLSWTVRLELARDITRGMGYLHSRGVMHRDLTSKNCLIRRQTGAKLSAIVADFGLAARLPRMSLTPDGRHVLSVVGTPYFSAPEVLRGERYDEKADVFSFGIILCQIIARIVADPDYLPRTRSFGVDEVLLREKCVDCPSVLWNLAMDCCQLDLQFRPDFPAAEQTLGATLLMPCPDTPPLPSELHSSRFFGLSVSLEDGRDFMPSQNGTSVRRSVSFNHRQRSVRAKSVDRTLSAHSSHMSSNKLRHLSGVFSHSFLHDAHRLNSKGHINDSVSSVGTDDVVIRDAVDEDNTAVRCAVDDEGFLTAIPCDLTNERRPRSLVRASSTPPVMCHASETFCVPQQSAVLVEEDLGMKMDEGDCELLLPTSQQNGWMPSSPTLTPPPTPCDYPTTSHTPMSPTDRTVTRPGRVASPKMQQKIAMLGKDHDPFPYSLQGSPRSRRRALATTRQGQSQRDQLLLNLDLSVGEFSPVPSPDGLTPDPYDDRTGSVVPTVFSASLERRPKSRSRRYTTLPGCVTRELASLNHPHSPVWQTNSAPPSPTARQRNVFGFRSGDSSGYFSESNTPFSAAAGQRC